MPTRVGRVPWSWDADLCEVHRTGLGQKGGAHNGLNVPKAIGECKAQHGAALVLQGHLLKVCIPERLQRQRLIPGHIYPKQLFCCYPEDVLQIAPCIAILVSERDGI